MINAALLERTDRLAQRVAQSRDGSRWEIAGGVGLGKTTLLHCLRQSLLARNFIPILVSPPAEALDTGPSALIQIGENLRRANVIDGEFEALLDPSFPWSKKLALTSGWIESHRESVVLLCDEPNRWPIAADAEARHASYNNARSKDIARWVTEHASCRRVLATPWSKPGESAEPYNLPQMDLPLLDLALGPLQPITEALKDRLGARSSRVSFLEMRLLVALAAVTSVEHAASRQADWPNCWHLAHTLIEAMESDPAWSPALHISAQVALARGPITPQLLERLGSHELPAHQLDVLLNGILQPLEETYSLHPVLKTTLAVRAGLDSEPRLHTHRTLMGFYRDCLGTADPSSSRQSEDELEGFYHAASCGERNSGLREFFPDQLHTLGRVLSKEHGDYLGAADVFRRAIRFDDLDDYAHHYLAYNLDCAASDRDLSRNEYLWAIDLNADHPWWWSRWINFLITTGRMLEAKQEWSRAMNALGTGGGRAANVIYEALHLWVARLLLHRVQLEFAEEVLEETPTELRTKHTGFRALDRLLEAMKIARNGRGVFPVNIAPNDYWRHPHLEFPKKLDEKPLIQWNPARVDAVDERTVYLVVGKHEDETGKTIYGHVELPVDRFDSASRDEKAHQITAGRLLELAFYGEEGVLLIRVHPDTPYTDPDLPLFDPPNPRRYLQKEAVSQ